MITVVYEFFVLDDGTKDLVMGVNWHKTSVGAFGSEMTTIVDIDKCQISQSKTILMRLLRTKFSIKTI
jgi:hypothetical protein